jgi:nuclear pore complex protein Nup133
VGIEDVLDPIDLNIVIKTLHILLQGRSHNGRIHSLAKLGKLATKERMDSPVVASTLQEDVKRLDDYVEEVKRASLKIS